MSIIRYPPLTVETAVDYLLANLSFNYEFQLSTMQKEDLDELYYSLGAYARGMLGLWSGNEALMESCRLVSGNNNLDADDASQLIIGLLWERLHAEDKLS
jgi:hypothetical protein